MCAISPPGGHYITNPNPRLKGRNPSNLPYICSVSFPLNGSHLMIPAEGAQNSRFKLKKKGRLSKPLGCELSSQHPFCCRKNMLRETGGFLTKPWSPWISRILCHPWDDCIFTYSYHTNQPNVGKYTSPMDGMGIACETISAFTHRSGKTSWEISESYWWCQTI